MRYYKIIKDGYLIAIGTGLGGEEITESEYNEIMTVIDSRPIPPAGFEYRLKTDLSWEQYELPTESEDSNEQD